MQCGKPLCLVEWAHTPAGHPPARAFAWQWSTILTWIRLDTRACYGQAAGLHERKRKLPPCCSSWHGSTGQERHPTCWRSSDCSMRAMRSSRSRWSTPSLTECGPSGRSAAIRAQGTQDPPPAGGTGVHQRTGSQRPCPDARAFRPRTLQGPCHRDLFLASSRPGGLLAWADRQELPDREIGAEPPVGRELLVVWRPGGC